MILCIARMFRVDPTMWFFSCSELFLVVARVLLSSCQGSQGGCQDGTVWFLKYSAWLF